MAGQKDSIDFLQLMGRDQGQSMLETNLPQYYREGFFSNDTLLHPELPAGRFGVPGAPVPYSLHNDSVITAILLGFFVLAVIAVSNIRDFLTHQLKNFFYVSRDGLTEMPETGTELRIQLYLVFLSCVLLSLLFYFYTLHYVGDNLILTSQYYLIAISLLLMMAYFSIKYLLYTGVNYVFFDSKRNRHWTKVKLFISSMEGIVLFPAVLLQTYFGMSERKVIIYFVIVLFLVKIVTFFKCYIVFFRRNVVKLQIILYFCALEIVPLLAFWGALDYMAKSLKINF